MRLAPISTLLVTVLSLWLTSSAWVGVDEGWAAYDRGDYATALEEWLPLVEQGDSVKPPFYGPLSNRVSGTGGRMFRA
jgi:hypothetical protein